MTDIPSLLTGDEEVLAYLRHRAIQYIDTVFDVAEYDLEHGDTATRTMAYRSVLPHLLTLARKAQEEEDQAEPEPDPEHVTALEEARQLLDHYRASLPAHAPLPTLPTAPPPVDSSTGQV